MVFFWSCFARVITKKKCTITLLVAFLAKELKRV